MKKPSPAQIAARKKFAEMARSGALNRKRQIASKANPMQKFTVLHRGTSNVAGQVIASGAKAAKQKVAEKLGIPTLSYLVAKKANPATGRKGSRTFLNPMAAPVESNEYRNFKYRVETNRILGGSGSFFETVAIFATKAQAEDYAKAILKSHPDVTLRIKTYK